VEKKLMALGKIEKKDLDQVGGKAGNLSSMAEAGFPVPEGFVIPIGTYNKFLEKLGLGEHISSMLENVDYDDEESVAAASKRIREAILTAEVEFWVRKEFGGQFEEMGPGTLWAVRSSAVAEDLPEASFAGQQDTFLNVRTESVPDFVKR